MENFLSPPPLVMAFLVMQKFVFLPTLLILALIKSIQSSGAIRRFALVSAALASVGLAFMFGPATLGLYSGAFPIMASTYTWALGGLLPHIAASVPLLIGFQIGNRFGTRVDWAHIALVFLFLGLWGLAG